MPGRVSSELASSLINKTSLSFGEGWLCGTSRCCKWFCCFFEPRHVCVWAWHQIDIMQCSSPGSHCLHDVWSWGGLASDQEARLKEVFVWDGVDWDQSAFRRLPVGSNAAFLAGGELTQSACLCEDIWGKNIESLGWIIYSTKSNSDNPTQELSLYEVDLFE